MQSRRQVAFTLHELLLVIAVLALLVALLLSGLRAAKLAGQRAECINNLRQMILMWHKYSGDHDDRLVLNHRPLPNTNALQVPWVSGDYHYETDTITNLALLTDRTYAAFGGPDSNPRVFKCPADKFDFEGVRTIRSFGMNQYMGAGGSSSTVPGFARFRHQPDVTRPADLFVFAELYPNTLCTSMARVPMDTNAVLDYFHLPGFRHNGRAELAFADGHVDGTRVQDKETLRNYTVEWIPDHQVPATNRDMGWFREHTTYLE
jgi:prepilin-type processing-associated H-X9-DG protein